jgi:hypothetical protein
MASSLMRKLTYAALTGFILFALTFVFITGLVTATNGIALAEGATSAIFPQPYFEILISLAIGFIPLADVIWQHTKDKETDAQTEQSNQAVAGLSAMISSFLETLKELKQDKTGMAGRHRRRRSATLYDAPRRRHRGHRRGVEPAGLKRWRLAHSHRTHDPSPRRHRFSRRRTHDPQPRGRFRRYASRAGAGIEGMMNKGGTLIGAALGLGLGIYDGYNHYAALESGYGKNAGQNYLNTIIGGDIKNDAGTVLSKRIPEVAHLWATNDPGGYNTLPYLKYKFLGIKPDGTKAPSAWVIPFWVGVIGALVCGITNRTRRLAKFHRLTRPAGKILGGMAMASAAGALFLPGCGQYGPQGLPPPNPYTVNMVKTPDGSYAQNPQKPNNMKIGGAF